MKKLPFIILVLGILITIYLSFNSFNMQKEKELFRFESIAKKIVIKLEDRMKAYNQVLNGGVGHFEASNEVTRSEWAAFVKRQNIEKTFPGIQGIGYSVVLKESEIEKNVKEVRAEGFSEYKIKPEGKRDFYTSIIYLEPFDIRNVRAFGYDMYSESVRREAMSRAIKLGEPALSGKVRLVQENGKDEQAGFLLYMPLYKKSMLTETTEQRVEAIKGFVHAPFRAKNFMLGVVEEDLDFVKLKLYDGDKVDEENLLYDSNVNAKITPDLSRVIHLNMYGRAWTLKLEALGSFSNFFDVSFSFIVFFGGILISLLLSALTFSLARMRQEALLLAENMTAQYLKTADRLELVTQSIDEGMYVTDSKGKIVNVNNFTNKLLGYFADELIGKNANELFYDYQENNNTLSKSSIKEATHFKRKDGTFFIVDIKSNRLIENGTFIGEVVIFRDITKAKELESNIIKAKEEAEKANIAKSDFLANMSHEIRTPLNGILGLTDLVLKTELSEKQRDYLEKAKNSSKALLYVINDILDYSKIEAGKLDLENRLFKLGDVMKNIMDLFEHQANQKGLLLNARSDNKLILIGDELRLTQILTNIVGNAIKFTEMGSIDIDVEKIAEDEHYIKLKFSVEDSGIGMAKEIQERLFSDFFQANTSTTRRFGGTGLGLAISKRLVKLMSGDIWIQSSEGDGSKFIFTATFGKIQEEDSKSHIDSDSKIGVNEQNRQLDASSIRGSKILLVEDNKINQIVAIGVLEGLEIEVDVANNGKEAVDKVLIGKKYDLILMDLQMPIMDGFEASKLIKEIDKNIPIVALSAAVMQNDIEKTKEAGIDSHLAKPINEAQLVKTLLSFIKPTQLQITSNETRAQAIGNKKKFDIPLHGVNMEELISRVGSNPKIIKHLFQNFCEGYENFDKKLEIENIDSAEFKRAIHSLKGISGNLSLVEVYNLTCDIYNTEDRTTLQEYVPKLLSLVKDTVEKLKLQIDEFEEELPSKVDFNKDSLLKNIEEFKNELEIGAFINNERVELLAAQIKELVNEDRSQEIKKFFSQFDYISVKDALKKIREELSEK